MKDSTFTMILVGICVLGILAMIACGFSELMQPIPVESLVSELSDITYSTVYLH